MNRNFGAGVALLLAFAVSLSLAVAWADGEMASVEVKSLPELSTPQAAWDKFTAALRQGRMRRAYGMLCDDSRREVTYRDFCVRWHPVSQRYQDVLQPPGFSEFRISGGVAVLRMGLSGDVLSGGRTARAVLVDNGSGWRVLDGPGMGNALSEAAARSTVQRLVKYSPLVRRVLENGGRITFKDLREENPRLFEEVAVKGFLRDYDITVDALRDGALIAQPRRKGLRGYRAGLDGRLVAFSGKRAERRTGEDLVAQRRRQQEQRLERERRAALQRLRQQEQARKLALQKKKEAELQRLREKTEAKLAADRGAELSGAGFVPDFSDPDKAESASVSVAVTSSPVDSSEEVFSASLEAQKAAAALSVPEQMNPEEIPGLPADLAMPELDDDLVRQAGRISAALKSEQTIAGGMEKQVLSQVELPDFVPMVPPQKGLGAANIQENIPIAEVDLGNGVFVVEEQEFDGTADELLDMIDKVDEALDGN